MLLFCELLERYDKEFLIMIVCCSFISHYLTEPVIKRGYQLNYWVVLGIGNDWSDRKK